MERSTLLRGQRTQGPYPVHGLLSHAAGPSDAAEGDPRVMESARGVPPPARLGPQTPGCTGPGHEVAAQVQSSGALASCSWSCCPPTLRGLSRRHTSSTENSCKAPAVLLSLFCSPFLISLVPSLPRVLLLGFYCLRSPCGFSLGRGLGKGVNPILPCLSSPMGSQCLLRP